MPVSRAARRRITTKLNKAIVDAIQKNGQRIFDQSQMRPGIPYDTGNLQSTGQFEAKKDGWMLKYGGNISKSISGKGAPYAARLHEGVSGEPIRVESYMRTKLVPKDSSGTGAKKRGRSRMKTVPQPVAGYTMTPKRRAARPWVRTAVTTKITYLLDDLSEALQKQFRARGGSIKRGGK
jgi:hypothetical protein